MPRPKRVKAPVVKRRKKVVSKKYTDWLGRPITKAQYERQNKKK